LAEVLLTILNIVANKTGTAVHPHELNRSCRSICETHGTSWPKDFWECLIVYFCLDFQMFHVCSLVHGRHNKRNVF